MRSWHSVIWETGTAVTAFTFTGRYACCVSCLADRVKADHNQVLLPDCTPKHTCQLY